jgi:hypothetical protein
LKQVGIQIEYQNSLPKWDDAFGDLYAQANKQIRLQARKEPQWHGKATRQ